MLNLGKKANNNFQKKMNAQKEKQKEIEESKKEKIIKKMEKSLSGKNSENTKKTKNKNFEKKLENQKKLNVSLTKEIKEKNLLIKEKDIFINKIEKNFLEKINIEKHEKEEVILELNKIKNQHEINKRLYENKIKDFALNEKNMKKTQKENNDLLLNSQNKNKELLKTQKILEDEKQILEDEKQKIREKYKYQKDIVKQNEDKIVKYKEEITRLNQSCYRKKHRIKELEAELKFEINKNANKKGFFSSIFEKIFGNKKTIIEDKELLLDNNLIEDKTITQKVENSLEHETIISEKNKAPELINEEKEAQKILTTEVFGKIIKDDENKYFFELLNSEIVEIKNIPDEIRTVNNEVCRALLLIEGEYRYIDFKSLKQLETSVKTNVKENHKVNKTKNKKKKKKDENDIIDKNIDFNQKKFLIVGATGVKNLKEKINLYNGKAKIVDPFEHNEKIIEKHFDSYDVVLVLTKSIPHSIWYKAKKHNQSNKKKFIIQHIITLDDIIKKVKENEKENKI